MGVERPNGPLRRAYEASLPSSRARASTTPTEALQHLSTAGRAHHKTSRRAAAAMAEAPPPSTNDCLAPLRKCLDPTAAAAITQLNAAINARVDRLTQAVEGPSPWLEVGRALVRQAQTTRPRSQPKPKPKPVPRRVVKEKPAPPPPAPAPAPACPQPPIIDAELTAAASKLQASERGRAARKRGRCVSRCPHTTNQRFPRRLFLVGERRRG